MFAGRLAKNEETILGPGRKLSSTGSAKKVMKKTTAVLGTLDNAVGFNIPKNIFADCRHGKRCLFLFCLRAPLCHSHLTE